MSDCTFEPCPFCGADPRHLEGKAGFWTERVICDNCDFHLPPKKWQARAVTKTEDEILRRATLRASKVISKGSLAEKVQRTTDNNLDLFYKVVDDIQDKDKK